MPHKGMRTEEGKAKRREALHRYWAGVKDGSILRKKADHSRRKIKTESNGHNGNGHNGNGHSNGVIALPALAAPVVVKLEQFGGVRIPYEDRFRNYSRLLWLLGREEGIKDDHMMLIFVQEKPLRI